MDSPESSTQFDSSKEDLLDLTNKYQVGRYLGSGRHDSAFLVNDGKGTKLVAMTPVSKVDFNDEQWKQTLQKLERVSIFDQIGLSRYVVHKVDQGLLPLKGTDQQNKSLVVEYGGESILAANTEVDRIEILRQMWEVLATLHSHGYQVHDFKTDHWLFQKDDQGKIQVKLVDYTLVLPVPKESMERNTNDHRGMDIISFNGLMQEFFPWFRSSLHWGLPHAEMQLETQQTLQRLEEESKTFSPRKKLQLKFLNALRGQIRR